MVEPSTGRRNDNMPAGLAKDKKQGNVHPVVRLTILFLASLMMTCWPGVGAFGQDSDQQGASAEEANEERADNERRVRRLGDVESDEYEFDLALPTAPRNDPEPVETLPLGDEELEARLQQALGILAIRQGDRQAQQEVDAILDEVLDRAAAAMEDGDFEEARSLLNAVRQVEPNKDGLSQAWERLAELQKPSEPVSRSALPPLEQSRKENRVTPESGYDLPNPAQAERLDQLLAMLAARPGSQAALGELDNLLEDLLSQARVAMQDGDFDTARELLDVVRSVNPRKRGLNETRRLLSQTMEIDDWLERARRAEQEGALVEPRLESAYYWYRQVLTVDRDNETALRGLRDIQQVMVVYALDAARNLDFELSEAWLEEAATIREDQRPVIEGRRQIEGFREERARAIEEEIVTAIRAGDYNLAEFKLIDLIALGGFEDRVTELRSRMTREESYGEYEPGQVIQDPFTDGAGFAPAVVVISSGSFVMGSRENEDGRNDSEGPQHRVTFERGFALGTHEVTVGQYRSFVRATGYVTEAERQRQASVWDEELGQLSDRDDVNWRHDFSGNEAADNLPVIHLTWKDAVAYVEWLSARTGRSYRLPSEAEFEYAHRAGSRSPYWWGDSRPRDLVENLAGQEDTSATDRRFSNYVRGYGDGHFGPAPVGTFAPNAWGLHDMAGNVSEWVQDCWHTSYVRAPNNGLAWENPGCDRRVVRGGYWASAPRQTRTASRMSAPVSLRTPQVGFRVARDLW